MHKTRRKARDDLLDETKRQAKNETRVMERTRAALIREIREGAKKLRLFDEMKR